MAEALQIDQKEYLPAPLAGKRFGYTGTYLIMLAKAGKVIGQKVGGRWYIEPNSVSAFLDNAEKAREVRSELLSETRREELKAYTRKEVTKQPVHAKGSRALLETLAILVIGLSIGAMGYFGTGAPQQAVVSSSGYSFLERVALSLYELISPGKTTTVKQVTYTATGTDSLPSVSVGTTTHTALVIGPGEVMNTTTVESIRDSFSDEVSVSIDPNNPDTGIIIPHFKTRDGESYRFLMVPLDEDKPVGSN